MTDIEILNKAITDLGAINVPNYLFEQVSLPIYNVRVSLIRLLEAINKNMQEKQPEEPEVEVVPVDMSEANEAEEAPAEEQPEI